MSTNNQLSPRSQKKFSRAIYLKKIPLYCVFIFLILLAALLLRWTKNSVSDEQLQGQSTGESQAVTHQAQSPATEHLDLRESEGHRDASPTPSSNITRHPAAVSEIILADGSLERILHTGDAMSPIRVRQILRKTVDQDEWKLVGQSTMAADHLLMRVSNEALEVLHASSGKLSYETIGSREWGIVRFSYDQTKDRLGEWLRVAESKDLQAEPDYQVRIAELFSNDPLFQSGQQPYLDGLGQYYEATLNLPALWEIQTDISSTSIAILDTGLRTTHVEFSGQLWINSAEIPDNGIDDDSNGFIDDRNGYDFVNNDSSPWDDHGHGTHVSGLVGASGNNNTGMSGVGWQAQLMPLKVLDSRGYGYISDMVEGIHYAIENGASVLLIALETESDSAALRDALQNAQDADVVWSVPAGNRGQSLMEYPHYPAVYDFLNQVTVGSHDLDGQYSDFSNYGIDQVDISAPGNDILSTGASSDTSFDRMTGTSQASALAAGVLAHLRSAFPNEPGWRLIQRLKDASSVRPRSNLSRTSYCKDYVATGRLDCSSANLLSTAPTPGNDDFENAWRYKSPAFVSQLILLDATAQVQEPDHAGVPAASTVWYRWTPQMSGIVTIQVDHPSASLVAYTRGGTITTLRPAATASPDSNGALLSFQAIAKVSYNIVINVPNGTAEPVRMELSQTPPNVDFESGALISADLFSSSSSVRGFLTSASTDIWYRWTAPSDASLRLNPRSDVTADLRAYYILPDGSLGDAIETTSVFEATPTTGLSFNTQAGQAYAFRWINLEGGNGYVSFNGTYQTAPEHVYISLVRPGYRGSNDESSTPPLIPTENDDAVVWGTETLLRSSLNGGSLPLTFKWYHNGSFVLEGRNLYIAKTLESHAGDYVLQVSNSLGTVSSDSLELKVLTLPALVRLIPDVINRAAGGSASIYADVTQSQVGKVNVKWFLNGTLIQDSSRRTLDLTDLATSDTGVLRALATNRFGSSYSQEVIINVEENPLENWKRILPVTPALNLSKAYFAGDRFFATSGDTLYTSPDGTSWNEATFDLPLSLIAGIAYGNGQFVAVGKRSYNGAIAVSSDGVFWTLVHDEVLGGYSFSSVAFGNGRFVTKRTYPSPGTTFFTSTDGVNWSTAAQSNAVLYAPVYFGNGTFLISQSGIHYTSTDGSNWVANAVAAGGPSRTGSLTYHDGYFYKLSGSSSTSIGIYRSIDGITWEVVSGPAYIGVTGDDDGLYYDGEHFIVPGSFGPQISTTGTGFTYYTGNLTGVTKQGWLGEFAIGNGTMIGITANGRIMSGSNVTDLYFDDSLFTYDFHRLEALDDVIIGLGSTIGSASLPKGITWSYDGLSWNINESVNLRDITQWNNRYYAISSNATNLISSSDLFSWEPHKLPGEAELIASGNDRLVVVLEDGQVTTSMDAINWTAPSATNGATDTPKILRFLNGEFWLARGSALYRSTDGITWTTSQLSGVRDITYANGKYIAGYGPSASLYTSTDGVTWTDMAPTGGLLAVRLKASAGTVVGANFSTLLYSEDSINWTLIDAETQMNDIAVFKNAIFYVGDDGLMYRNGDLIDGPVIEADLKQVLSADLLQFGEIVEIPYNASSIAETLSLTLYVDGIAEDSSSDGSALAWSPSSPGLHEVWLEATDSNGLKQRTSTVQVNVRSGAALMVTPPIDLNFTSLYAHEDKVWIGTESGQLYFSKENSSSWRLLDLPTIDRIKGMAGGLDGRKYLYGATFDAFGVERGFVLRSRDGIFWEKNGSQLEYPVIDVIETSAAVFAIIQNLNDINSSAPTQLLFNLGDEDWTLASSNDTLRSLVDWQGRLYAKDRFGDILVSDDGFEWSAEFSNGGSSDTRTFTLLPSDDALLFAGTSRVYHNRFNGQDWGYDSSYNRAASIDGIAYLQTNSGVFTLSPDGNLMPTSHFSTLFTGSFETVIETATSEQQVFWLTSTGRIIESIGDTPDKALDAEDFNGYDIRLIEGIPFRVDMQGNTSTLESRTTWSSASFQSEAEANNMKSFAYGANTALFIGTDGAYRHNSVDDTWSLLPNSQDILSLTFSDGRFWLVGTNRADYSDDGGTTWNTFFTSLQAVSGSTLTATNVIADGDRVAINGVNRNVLYSSDRGITWIDVGLRADRISFSDNDLILSGGTYKERLTTLEDGVTVHSIETFPFDFQDYLSGTSWGVRDYILNNGIEYIAVSNPTKLSILSRQIGGAWQIILHPAPVTSTTAIFAKDGNRTFIATDRSAREIVLHNIKASLVTTGLINLGVGDHSNVQIEFTNQGYGTAPEKDNVRILAMLQPSGTVTLDESVQIGEAAINLPELLEGESETISMAWRIPSSVEPGSYYVGISANGLGDAYNGDNTALTEDKSVIIAARTINIEAQGSGLGTIVNLDQRESYPDKFSLSLIITPDPGYVYSASATSNESINPASLTTVILDGSFNGNVYFEPSYETWAAAQISSPANRGRGAVVGRNTTPNIFKYLLGMQADAENQSSVFEILEDTESAQKVVQFRVVHGRENEPFSVKASSDLNEWNALQPDITDEGSWLLFESTVPAALSDRAFFRLEAPE
jgi:subtilisin family serine protease